MCFPTRYMNARVIKFIAGNVLVFLSKLGFTYLLVFANIPALPAYIITHILIFFVGYWFHCHITFKQPIGWSTLKPFSVAASTVKLLDVLVFALFLEVLDFPLVLAIVLVTPVIMVYRYFALKFALLKNNTK